MNWAFQRQLFYASILIAAFLALGFFVTYPQLNKEPSCMDRKQNGDEVGVDCGGSCMYACISQVDPVAVLWARAFKVTDRRYNAVAYVENHNSRAAIRKIKYEFRFSDAENLYIGKRNGETFIPPGGKFAIFEPALDVGNSIPVYTSFEFTELPQWVQVSEKQMGQLQLFVSDINLEDAAGSPKLSAVLKNNSLFSIPNIEAVAILYDSLGNAITASSTYVKELNTEESSLLNFTWPEAIQEKITTKEIIPMFDVFSVKLK